MKEISKDLAVKLILADWDAYEACQKKAISMGKHFQTLRKLFYQETGLMLPILCWWNSREEMVAQYSD